jgi:hypothetical protein
MAIHTLNDLRKLHATMLDLEQRAKRSHDVAEKLRKCGGYKDILAWRNSRIGAYRDTDYDGITKLLEDAVAEFGPAILEILAARQELISHEAMTQAVLKRVELSTFVMLESECQIPSTTEKATK